MLSRITKRSEYSPEGTSIEPGNESPLVLSTVTPSGFDVALEILGEAVFDASAVRPYGKSGEIEIDVIRVRFVHRDDAGRNQKRKRHALFSVIFFRRDHADGKRHCGEIQRRGEGDFDVFGSGRIFISRSGNVIARARAHLDRGAIDFNR